MRSKKLRKLFPIKLVLLLTMGIIVIAACAPATSDTVVETQIVEVEVLITPTSAPMVEGLKTVVWADGQEPVGLYTPLATGPPGTITYLLYEPLVGHNEDLTPNTDRGLATSWEVSEDKLTWTFYLREGVKFHDGTDFNAESVKYHFDTVLDPDTAAFRRNNFLRISEINVVDDYTVEFVTVDPFPDFPFLLMDRTAFIAGDKALAEMGIDDFHRNPVGTGPYKFVEWAANDHITFEAFDDYWDGRPSVDQVIFRQVPEDASRTAMLHTGEIDIALNVAPEDLTSLDANENITIYRSDSLTNVHSEMKQTLPPFSNQKVRLAMNLAVDNQAIIDNIMRGAGTMPQSAVPNSMDCFYPSDPYGYDPDRARELLVEAGYPNGVEGTLWYVPGRWGGDTQVSEALQAYWLAVGIDMSIMETDQAHNNEIVNAPHGEYPGHTSMQIRTSPYANFHLYRLLHSSASAAGYSNPEVDRLLDLAKVEFDVDTKCELLADAQVLIWEDAPYIEIFVRQNLLGVRDNVTGFEFLPIGDLRLTDVEKN